MDKFDVFFNNDAALRSQRLDAAGELVIEHGPGQASLRVEHGPDGTNLVLEGAFKLAGGLDAEVAANLGLGGGAEVRGSLSMQFRPYTTANIEVEHDASGTTAVARVRVKF
jgi:hypothetical protein